MAKSIRSKSKRRFRAIKRARNGPRETAKLKAILANQSDTDIKKLAKDNSSKTSLGAAATAETEIAMEIENKKTYSSKTMLDEHGQLPCWMNARRARKQTKINKNRAAKKKKTKGKKK